jgi:hypothetical protein
MNDEDLRLETTPSGANALVRWQHSSDGPAFCLARLVVRPAPAPPVIVLTEVAGNPDAVGLTSDFAGAATAALSTFGQQAALDPRAIVWLAQHGEFSSYDAAGAPETFTEVRVSFDGTRYYTELTDHRLLSVAEAEIWREALQLDPVRTVLSGLHTGS